jgi:hypothetical protein
VTLLWRKRPKNLHCPILPVGECLPLVVTLPDSRETVVVVEQWAEWDWHSPDSTLALANEKGERQFRLWSSQSQRVLVAGLPVESPVLAVMD